MRGSVDSHILAIECQIKQLDAQLAEIERLCRRHNHPGVNVGAMKLAGRVIEIIEAAQSRHM